MVHIKGLQVPEKQISALKTEPCDSSFNLEETGWQGPRTGPGWGLFLSLELLLFQWLKLSSGAQGTCGVGLPHGKTPTIQEMSQSIDVTVFVIFIGNTPGKTLYFLQRP